MPVAIPTYDFPSVGNGNACPVASYALAVTEMELHRTISSVNRERMRSTGENTHALVGDLRAWEPLDVTLNLEPPNFDRGLDATESESLPRSVVVVAAAAADARSRRSSSNPLPICPSSSSTGMASKPSRGNVPTDPSGALYLSSKVTYVCRRTTSHMCAPRNLRTKILNAVSADRVTSEANEKKAKILGHGKLRGPGVSTPVKIRTNM